MKFSAKPAEGMESYLSFPASNKSRYIIRQIMRLSLITAIVIGSTFQILFASASKAQRAAEVELTMELKNESVLSAIKKIEQQTDFRFIFRNGDIREVKNLNLPLEKRSVAEILNLILKENGLSFSEVNRKILISKITPSTAATALADTKIMGIVLDDEDQPLPGVTITIKGDKSTSAATDFNGHFNITIPSDGNQILVFSYIGFKTQEVAVGTSTSLKVTLIAAAGSLKEVVVLGYSVQKKESITGSVATVSGAELRQSPAANISNSLAGRLPGLIAFQGSGQPGRDDSRLLIRGISSSKNSSPLIVIDGIPQEAADINGIPVNSVLPHMDPSDIENISILKDAGTAAVYGARAANGVILITTRRGDRGKPSLNYTFNSSWQKPTRLADLVNSYEYATLLNEMYRNENNFNPSANRGYTDEQLEVIRSGSDPDRYANTDWYKALMKPSSFQQRHNISVNGGGEKSKYFISTGYLDQKGLFEAAGYKQYSLRTNMDADISKNLKVSLNLNGRLEKTKDQVAGSSITSQYRTISPLLPSRFSNGTYNYISIVSGYSSLINGSPYLMGKGDAGYVNTDLNVLESVGALTYNVPFISGLTAKGTLSYNKYQTYIKNFTKPYVTSVRNDDGTYITRATGNTRASLTEQFIQRQSVLAEASLSYKKTINKHNIDLLALYTQTENQGNRLMASRGNFASPQVDQLFAGDPVNDDNYGSAFKNARQSVVGRAAYNYSGKYLVEFSFRYDGSDVFPKNDRFGFFPSVSAGWILSEESFLKDVPAINFLKVRGSYGRLGNDRVGQFEYLNSFILGNGLDGYYIYGNTEVQALVPGVIPNASFTWEKANIGNVGLEARLFNNKLGIEADYFYKRTKDILGNRAFSVPGTIGGSLPSENLNIIDNKGFELALDYRDKIGAVDYFVKPNITFNKNKVVYMPEPAGFLPYQSAIGHPFYVASGNLATGLGYISEGLYQSAEEVASGPTPLYPTTTAAGDIKYKDINGDGKITTADKTIIGKGDYPELIYGLSMGANYKGFDISVLFQGAARVEKYMNGLGEWAFAGNSVPSQKHLDRWTPDNPDASYPRLFSSYSNNKEISSYWLRNGSYLRLKNLELGYTVPAAALSKLKISNARFYISGTNLFTITSLKDVDPEAFASSFGAESYLIQKVFNLGLSVKF